MPATYQSTSSQNINAVKSCIDFVSGPGMLVVKYLDNTDAFEVRYLECGSNNSTIYQTLPMLSNRHRIVRKTLVVNNEANDLPVIFEQ